MNQRPRWFARFVAALFGMLVLSTLAWSRFVDNHLYSCSDGVMGYPIPADLIALTGDSWPLKTVPQIPQATGMNDPDLIKEGWSPGSLWALWAGFVGVTLAVSATVATLPFRRRRIGS